MPRSPASSVVLNFKKVSPYTPKDKKASKFTKKDPSLWRNITFIGEVPSFQFLEKLNEYMGNDVPESFSETFKRFIEYSSINNSEGNFVEYKKVTLFFKCKGETADVIKAFFASHGYKGEFALCKFAEKKEENRE